MLYVAALFHDTGLVLPYRGTEQRFELDSADTARDFLISHGFSAAEADVVWTAIALHTTPEVPYKMDPVIAATTAGVETDVLGIRLDAIDPDELRRSPPRIRGRTSRTRSCRRSPTGSPTGPTTTFGTVNADVLEHFVPGFRRIDFVDVIKNSAWPE